MQDTRTKTVQTVCDFSVDDSCIIQPQQHQVKLRKKRSKAPSLKASSHSTPLSISSHDSLISLCSDSLNNNTDDILF